MSQALRKLAGAINRTNCAVVFINQLREKIGVMFGNPGDHHRRQGAQVLRLAPARHPAHRPGQGARDGDRQPRAGEGGEEQGGAAVPAGRVRRDVRRGHQPHRRCWSTSPARPASSRSRAPGTPTATSASGRAARTPSSSSRTTCRSWPKSRSRCGSSSACARRRVAGDRPTKTSESVVIVKALEPDPRRPGQVRLEIEGGRFGDGAGRLGRATLGLEVGRVLERCRRAADRRRRCGGGVPLGPARARAAASRRTASSARQLEREGASGPRSMRLSSARPRWACSTTRPSRPATCRHAPRGGGARRGWSAICSPWGSSGRSSIVPSLPNWTGDVIDPLDQPLRPRQNGPRSWAAFPRRSSGAAWWPFWRGGGIAGREVTRDGG